MALGLGTEYPIISSNLSTGLGVYGTCDPYNTAAPNNGALNPLGSVYFIPSSAQGGNTTLPSVAGYASGLWVKYVRYYSSGNAAATVAGPGVVYYIDETFTTVSGTFSEGNAAGTGNSSSAAGFLLPNSGTAAGYGLGSTAFTKTILNGNYVFIGLAGFIPGAWLGYSGAAAYDPVVGASGGFILAKTTGVLRTIAFCCSTIGGSSTNTYADIYATIIPF
jgi:hypothetical protein